MYLYIITFSIENDKSTDFIKENQMTDSEELKKIADSKESKEDKKMAGSRESNKN